MKKKRYFREDVKMRRRDYELRRAFGLSLSEYSAIVVKQNGVCAICMEPENRFYKGGPARQTPKKLPLAVDHDHNTGHVRGLLCADCNQALGLFEDRAQLLRAAARYLEEHAGNVTELKVAGGKTE